MSELKLYGANVCPFVHRARLTLAEKGLGYEYVAIDLRDKPDWFYQVLPTGKVPLLEHKGYRIWESAVVCEYLEEVFAQPALLPSDPAKRAEARIWIAWSGDVLVSLFYRLLKEQDSSKWEEHRAALRQALEKLDSELADRAWLLGDQLTLADLELYPWFERWQVLEHYRGFSIPSECKGLGRWKEALASRPTVAAIAEKPEFYVTQYRSYAEPAAV